MTSPEESFKPYTLSKKEVRNKTLFSFAFFVLVAVGGWAGFQWVKKQPQKEGTPGPLRAALSANEKLFSALFDSSRLIKEYPLSAAVKNVRVNGNAGMKGQLDTATWKMQVVRSSGDTLLVTLADLQKLPKKEVVFDFKCIEGWSQVTHWGGVPLQTFMKAYNLTDEAQMNYIGLQTPDKQYYVGIDMPSALQQQTLLCYEMNGKPLPQNQGYPLRLIIPVKYGIKHLKRIGTLFFSNSKPPDYWAQRGYDYYAGH